MKILKENDAHLKLVKPDWNHKYDCDGCHSKLSVDADDLKGNSGYFDMICPICKEVYTLYSVPPEPKNYAYRANRKLPK